jgi:hypothetical protein
MGAEIGGNPATAPRSIATKESLQVRTICPAPAVGPSPPDRASHPRGRRFETRRAHPKVGISRHCTGERPSRRERERWLAAEQSSRDRTPPVSGSTRASSSDTREVAGSASPAHGHAGAGWEGPRPPPGRAQVPRIRARPKGPARPRGRCAISDGERLASRESTRLHIEPRLIAVIAAVCMCGNCPSRTCRAREGALTYRGHAAVRSTIARPLNPNSYCRLFLAPGGLGALHAEVIGDSLAAASC